jgi:hypothetical protein
VQVSTTWVVDSLGERIGVVEIFDDVSTIRRLEEHYEQQKTLSALGKWQPQWRTNCAIRFLALVDGFEYGIYIQERRKMSPVTNHGLWSAGSPSVFLTLDGMGVAPLLLGSAISAIFMEFLRADVTFNEKFENVVVISQPPIPKGVYTAKVESMMSKQTAETKLTVKGKTIIE